MLPHCWQACDDIKMIKVVMIIIINKIGNIQVILMITILRMMKCPLYLFTYLYSKLCTSSDSYKAQ